jgi:HK97 family phage major capsid protein
VKRSQALALKARDTLAEVKALDSKAETGELTDGEKAERSAKMAEATRLYEDSKTQKAEEDAYESTVKSLEELGLELPEHGALDPNGKAGDQRSLSKSLGQMVTGSEQFKALMASYPDGRIPEKSRVQSDPVPVGAFRLGAKALLTGVSDTSGGAFVVNDQSGIVEMLGRRPLTIRDLVSVRRTGSDTVEYVTQTAHTNAAAFTAEATTSAGPTANTTTGVISLPAGSGVKPEGSWTFARATAVVKTIAEWVPATKRSLADVAALEGLINDELVADLAETEETQMVQGNGAGENLQGILGTSGVQAQAFSTDIFQTVRKAITKARTIGRSTPTGIAMNPADVETIDLAKGTDGHYLGSGPFQGGPRTLWGYPIVESEAIPAAQAIVADWRKAVLWDREQATVTVSDSHADFFTRNLVAILAEQREAFAVIRPTAFVVAALV